MVKLSNLSYSILEKELYQDISFTLQEQEHCALIGSSGTGKSTLVDIIMNPDRYSFDGTLELDAHCRIGYVRQFYKMDKTREQTVFEYIAEDFTTVQEEITSICTEMETASDMEALLEQYQNALDCFSAMDGDNYESNITRKLNLAHLNKHADQQVSSLSGGEFKLVQVIKEMLRLPDLMIMDEPDAFLDFENLNSLKELINAHKGIMLVITHNRYLLNHCFNKILHLENTELQEFSGTYMDYNLSLLQKKIELQELAFADAEEIERNEKIVEKLRADASFFTCAARGRTLNARVSLLDRLEKNRIKEPFVDIKQPDICFHRENREGTWILKVQDYGVAFEDVLLERVAFEMSSTDKVALVGPNGTGKTTLLRDIYQNQKEGITLNEGNKTAFLSQLQGEMLSESNTVEDEFFEAGFQTYGEIEVCLLRYGLKKEVMKQRIETLSGGEKTLLQLAKIAAGKTDLLLLDEPTSHLDTYSQIALEKAIAQYSGAVLMISHDFYSIVNCVDYVLFIEDKTIRKMSMRSFRKMIYVRHFDKDYLEMEQKKTEVERNIERALEGKDFPLAKILTEELMSTLG